jgi:hypothetical protein
MPLFTTPNQRNIRFIRFDAVKPLKMDKITFHPEAIKLSEEDRPNQPPF